MEKFKTIPVTPDDGEKREKKNRTQRVAVDPMNIVLKVSIYNYQTSVLTHGSETSALRKAVHDLLERTEPRMLRCTMGMKRIEKIGRGEISTRTGVAKVSKFDTRLLIC